MQYAKNQARTQEDNNAKVVYRPASGGKAQSVVDFT